ncbi:response regulator [Methylomonas sp. MgM2]
MNVPTKLLIVDDDLWNRKYLEILLADGDYQIRSAESGLAALTEVAVYQPDLILLDIMMPEVDGFEVIRRLQANPDTRHIPVVVVTALDDEGSRSRLESAGIDNVIGKPIDRWALQACIDNLLGDKHGSD